MENRNSPTYHSVFGMAPGPTADSFLAFVQRFGGGDVSKVLFAAYELYRDVLVSFDAQARDEDVMRGRIGTPDAAHDPYLPYKLRGVAEFVSQFAAAAAPSQASESENVDSAPKKRKSRIGK